ncbi:AbrB/MazE/SpoVT family DNA-binding domain-containing protein [Candidatus Woesearchaeota archaeon]|nr:AbrB/MazE/SpoVT family DNA-binding domain-containing protein [Candidatus Woesearchaeota archaeon]
MKRKVIQIADSTQLVSLPRKWAVEHGIKKGDEVEVKEEGNKIIVSTEKGEELGKVEVDITGLDRDSLMFLIRCLYIRGYDEIHVKFNRATTRHHKIGKEVTVISSINQEVGRMNGIEIIQQKENYCLIKDLSEGSIKEFDTVLRRIFLLLIDGANDIILGTSEQKKYLLEGINEKHNTITKFVAYNLRLLNKFGYTESYKTNSLYHTISSLDEIIDILKYVSRYIMENDVKPSKETLALMGSIQETLGLFHDFFYQYGNEKVEKISGERTAVLERIKSVSKRLSPHDMFIVTNMEQILEIVIHLVVTRMALEY